MEMGLSIFYSELHLYLEMNLTHIRNQTNQT